MRWLMVLIGLLVSRPAAAEDTWSDPHPGVRRLLRVTSTQYINVLVVDLCAAGVSVRATGTGERQRTVTSFADLVDAQAAVNGDFFSYATYSTTGPARHDGAAWGGSDNNFVAPLQFGANQVALPANTSTAGVEPWAREVVSGHPSLVVGGAPRDNSGYALCTERHPRTAAGLNAAKDKLYLAVIDGRATNRIGMTCGEVATLLIGLGATDAVNLDGGGSSTMWIEDRGVVNHPSDGSQRVVANHLAIRARGTGDAPNCPVRRYEASFAAMQAPPAELTSGEEAVVWMELANDGNVAWDVDTTRVGTQDPMDRESAFYKAENWINPSRPTSADHSGYGPGAIGRFSWVMLAPEVTESTHFDETFQLVQEGVAWFGPTQTMSILVHPRSGPTEPVDPGDDDDPEAPGDGGCSAGSNPGGAAALLLALVSLGGRRRRRRR